MFIKIYYLQIGLSFADTSYTEEVLENATANTLLKTIVIINHRAHSENIPLKCEISKGNDQSTYSKLLINFEYQKRFLLYILTYRTFLRYND